MTTTRIKKDQQTYFTFPDLQIDQEDIPQDAAAAKKHHEEHVFLTMLTDLTNCDLRLNREEFNRQHNIVRNEIARQLVQALRAFDRKFILKALIQAGNHPLFTDTQAAAILEAEIKQQITSILNDLPVADMTDDDKVEAAQSLIKFSARLSPAQAMDIMIDSTRLNVFTNSGAIKSIMQEINKNKSLFSALMNTDKTLRAVRAYEAQHPEDVRNFMTDPQSLLSWLNQASPVEAARLLSHYFAQDSEYYNAMRSMVENVEISRDLRYEAFLCYVLMCPGQLTTEGKPNGHATLAAAMRSVQAATPNRYPRLMKSLQASLDASRESIVNASGCFMNLHKLKLPDANLTNLDLKSAKFNKSEMQRTDFSDSDLSLVQFEQASLTSAKFLDARLTFANMRFADLRNVSFENADLGGVDFTGADLTGAIFVNANLNGAIFENTKLDNVVFFSQKTMLDKDSSLRVMGKLHKDLGGHKYFEPLQDAIVKDFIEYFTQLALPTPLKKIILQHAYKHPLFIQDAKQNSASAIKAITMQTVSNLATGFMSFFSRSDAEQANVSSSESNAQKQLREAIADLDNPARITRTPKRRPPPPRQAPAPPPQAEENDEQLRVKLR